MNLNEIVRITPFEPMSGKIIGIYLSNAPTKFLVRYFMDSDIKEEYFLADELEVLK